MSGMWHRTLVYLGLKEEPEEGYDELPERYVAEEAYEGGAATGAAAGGEDAVVRPLHTGDVHVRAVPSGSGRTAVVEVRTFDDVEKIGSRYRMAQAVLFDVSGTDKATGRRVLDFVSGLTYASRGSLSKVGSRAFLLVPDGVELPDDEVQRLTTLGYRLPTGSEA